MPQNSQFTRRPFKALSAAAAWPIFYRLQSGRIGQKGSGLIVFVPFRLPEAIARHRLEGSEVG